MSSISDAYNYVIEACNDENIGYSQNKRTTIKLNASYKTYCDCSSLISWALTKAGYFSSNPWFTTANETDYLVQLGFTEYDPQKVSWQPGDILWRRKNNAGHTEMVYVGNGATGRTMGAHTDSYAFAKQVSINSSYTSASSWTKLYRAPDGGQPITITDWYQGDGTFSGTITAEEKESNAVSIANWMQSNYDATDEAIAGVLGNLDHESGLDPNIWYNGTIGSVAYGLPQFNPASGYRDKATSAGVSLSDATQNGTYQMRCIFENILGGWIPTTTYPYSITEFCALTDVTEATNAFYYEFERGGESQYGDRLTLAKEWLEKIPDFPSDPGGHTSNSYWWYFLGGYNRNFPKR